MRYAVLLLLMIFTHRGNIGRQTIEGPGTWSFDANMSKSFKISESKQFQLRVDAVNVLNHPNPIAPTLNLNSTDAFGLKRGDKVWPT